jgi:hypothetical protein
MRRRSALRPFTADSPTGAIETVTVGVGTPDTLLQDTRTATAVSTGILRTPMSV